MSDRPALRERLPRGLTRLLDPPESLHRGPFRAEAWRSPVRSERTATRLGLAVAVCFGICFVTGLLSHLAQQPPGWFSWPARPLWLYRLTQGLHVVTGFATVPLLLAKLWSVYPKLFGWPPVRSAGHAVGRLGIFALVASGLFMLVTGILNVARWYTPMPFFFTVAHYWMAWVTIGAILVHVGTRLLAISRGLRRREPKPHDGFAGPADEEDADRADAPQDTGGAADGALTRRGLLVTAVTASGVLAATTAGQTVPWLAPVAVLAARDPGVGSQGLPVNKSAASAGVEPAALDPTFRLLLDGPRPARLSLAQLRSMSRTTVRLPIVCVEGWSADAEWTGIPVQDLLDLMGVPAEGRVRIESLQQGGLYRSSVLAPPHSRDPLTLLALRLNGEFLNLDHGYPLRLMAPNRPGVLQTKWVHRIVAL